MKKILVLLCLAICSNVCAFAQCDYKCVSPYDRSSAFSAFFSKLSGSNKTTEKVAETAIKKAINKKLKTDNLDVDIVSFSAKDLKNGIFKSAHIKGENVILDKYKFASVDLKTLCDFNYVKYENKDVIFKEDLPLSFNLKLSSDNLNSMIPAEKYQDIAKKLNKYCDHIPGFNITSTKLSLKSDKLVYTIGYKIPIIKKEQHFDISTDLYVKDGKIKLKDYKLLSSLIKLDANKIMSVLPFDNPLDFSTNIIDDKNAKINIEDIQIKDGILNIGGIAIVPKE